jgi:hypothetical protein
MDSPFWEGVTGQHPVIEKCVNRGVGPASRDDGKRTLGTTHYEQIIVNQRHGS